MKKIIAAAVATAFVAPAFAADVTVSGDVEYKFTNQGSVDGASVHDSDIKVSATEDLGNGMMADVYLVNASNASTFASALGIEGSFGRFEVGNDNDNAAQMFDDKSDVAPANGGDHISSGLDGTQATVSFSPNTGVEGLSLAVSYSAESTLATDVVTTEITDQRVDTTGSETMMAYGVQYATGGFAISAGGMSVDTDDTNYEDPTTMSASFAMGPVYVGYNKVNNNAGDADSSITGVGLTYSYGPGKLFYESVDAKKADSTDYEETAFGATYGMGGVTLYVESMDKTDEGAEADNTTTVGVTYAF
jgi:hypothetical protein